MTKIGQVLWLAFQYAKQDRKSLANAWGNDETEETVKNCIRDIRDFERLQIRLFGTDKSELQSKIEKMKLINILDLLDKDLED